MALATANEMARRDELTGTKNKMAYQEMEEELQRQIDEGDAIFGIVVCDVNGLKLINDHGDKGEKEWIIQFALIPCCPEKRRWKR